MKKFMVTINYGCGHSSQHIVEAIDEDGLREELRDWNVSGMRCKKPGVIPFIKCGGYGSGFSITELTV